MPEQENITELLLEFSNGKAIAVDALLPIVYDELKRLASNYLRRERSNHTLQPTALVHEAYIRLIDQTRVNWQNRAHFFGIAANVMRRILVDHARQRNAENAVPNFKNFHSTKTSIKPSNSAARWSRSTTRSKNLPKLTRTMPASSSCAISAG